MLRLHDHTQTHHIQLDSPTRGIGPSQIPLPDSTQHSQEKDIHAPGGIRIRNPSKRAAADPRLRPRGHSDRHICNLLIQILQVQCTGVNDPNMTNARSGLYTSRQRDATGKNGAIPLKMGGMAKLHCKIFRYNYSTGVLVKHIYILHLTTLCSGSLSPRHGASSGCG